MKMKMKMISDLGIRNADLGIRNADLGRGVAGGEWRVTRNEQRATSDFFGFPRSRGAAKGLFYRRGAEGAEDDPGGAGPYRSLNARIPSEKNLCGLCVSAVRNRGLLVYFLPQSLLRQGYGGQGARRGVRRR